MMTEDQEQRFSCRFCNKNFSSGKSLSGHMRCHLALIYAEKCKEDDVGFEEFHKKKKVPFPSDTDPQDVGESSYELRETPKKSWSISDANFKNIDVCKECGKGFSSLKALGGHMRIHSVKRKKCAECGKGFDSMRALFGHMRCHPKRSRVSNEMACPIKKKTSTTRYNTTNSDSDSFVHFTEVDEVKEVAMCLMMLSRGVRRWDEFSLSIDATKFSTSGNHESWSCQGEGFAGKEDDLRSEYGGNETRKMKKPRVDIEPYVSRFCSYGSCFAIDDKQKSEFHVSYDQSLGCEKFKNTPDMKKGIVSPTELELNDSVSKARSEQVDMGLQKANSRNKPNFVDDQFEFKCKTCNKTLKTPQALGSHRTTHRTKSTNESIIRPKEESCRYVEADSEFQKLRCNDHSLEHDAFKTNKEHQCAICFKVFASGQALGGHKRAHYVGLIESNSKEITLMEKNLPDNIGGNLDLNFPANVEEYSLIDVGSKQWWGLNDFEYEPRAIIN